MSGGIAPTTEPTTVLKGDSYFIGVYTPAYSKILLMPRIPVNGLQPSTKTAVPAAPLAAANATDAFIVSRPDGSGLARVRAILPSLSTS